MKKFLLSLAVLASAAFGASAAELCSVSFDQKSAMPTTQGGYNLTWSYTQNDKEWTIVNFHHNSGNWAADGYIKAIGKKTTNATATISTGFAVSGTATEVIVKAKKGVSSATGSLDILGSSSADFTNATKLGTVDLSKVSSTADDVKISLTGAKADMFYRLLLTASNSTQKNGAVWVYSITINGTPAVVDPDAIATPEMAEPVAGTEGYTITLSCATEGAEIYYTTDGTDPTNVVSESCLKYEAPFELYMMPVTVKAIAYKGEKSSAMLSKFVDEPNLLANLSGLSNYRDAISAGQEVKFKSATPNATVAYQNGNYLYLSTGTGYMATNFLVYGKQAALTPGQAITSIEGTYYEYNGLPEIKNCTLTAGEVGKAPAPLEAEAISGYIELNQLNMWYTVKGVSIKVDTQNNKTTMELVVPSEKEGKPADVQSVALYNQFGVSGFEAGENLTVSGFVSLHNGEVQFLPTEILNEQGEKICAVPVFSLADGAYTENTEITISCETEGATIVYTVNGEAEVEALAPARLTLTEAMEISAYAKAEGYTNSDPVTASYTIKAAEPVIGTSATFDFSSAAEFAKITCTPAITYPTSDGQNVGGSEMTVNGVSVTTTDGSTATRLWAKDGTLRVYTGGSISVSIGSEFILSKITFTGTLNAETTTGYLNGKVWTAEKPETAARAAAKIQKVVFNCTDTNKIKKIEVEVEFASDTTGIEAIEAEDAAPAVYYNLQGVRVENPANGLYIRVNGKKAEKVFIR